MVAKGLGSFHEQIAPPHLRTGRTVPRAIQTPEFPLCCRPALGLARSCVERKAQLAEVGQVYDVHSACRAGGIHRRERVVRAPDADPHPMAVAGTRHPCGGPRLAEQFGHAVFTPHLRLTAEARADGPRARARTTHSSRRPFMPPVTAMCAPSPSGAPPGISPSRCRIHQCPRDADQHHFAACSLHRSHGVEQRGHIVEEKAALRITFCLHPALGTQHGHHVHQTAVWPFEVTGEQPKDNGPSIAGRPELLCKSNGSRNPVQPWRQAAWWVPAVGTLWSRWSGTPRGASAFGHAFGLQPVPTGTPRPAGPVCPAIGTRPPHRLPHAPQPRCAHQRAVHLIDPSNWTAEDIPQGQAD